MIKFCILASGSSGNCAVLQTGETAVLIDCGCGARHIEESLREMSISPSDISAALITHAHGDHISAPGLNFLIKNKIKTYSRAEVFDDAYEKYGSKLDDCRLFSFNSDLKIKDISVGSFAVYHKDAKVSKTIGFSLSAKTCGEKYKIGYATDTGKVCKNIIENLLESDILALEANYDPQMLETSFRPEENKRWILSDYGHLSNCDAAKAAAEIKINSKSPRALKYVFLSHLSEHHNSARAALKTAQKIFSDLKISGVNLLTANRKTRSQAIAIK